MRLLCRHSVLRWVLLSVCLIVAQCSKAELSASKPFDDPLTLRRLYGAAFNSTTSTGHDEILVLGMHNSGTFPG